MGADQITKDMTMQELLAVFPGAQRERASMLSGSFAMPGARGDRGSR